MKRLFTEHPGSVGETYIEHMAAAASFGVAMLFGAFAAFVHAIFPFLFVKTGSRIITQLHDRMVVNRIKTPKARFDPAHNSLAEQAQGGR